MTANSIRTIRVTSRAEDYFEHHFPNKPVVPGALTVAWLEHSGGLLVCHLTDGRSSAVISELRRVAYLRPAYPGDCLVIAVQFEDRDPRSALRENRPIEASGAVACEGDVIVRAQFSLSIVPYAPSLSRLADLSAALGMDRLVWREDP